MDASHFIPLQSSCVLSSFQSSLDLPARSGSLPCFICRPCGHTKSIPDRRGVVRAGRRGPFSIPLPVDAVQRFPGAVSYMLSSAYSILQKPLCDASVPSCTGAGSTDWQLTGACRLNHSLQSIPAAPRQPRTAASHAGRPFRTPERKKGPRTLGESGSAHLRAKLRKKVRHWICNGTMPGIPPSRLPLHRGRGPAGNPAMGNLKN